MSKVIGIDVDLTACAIDELWYKWLVAMTGKEIPSLRYAMEDRCGVLDYNLSSYFNQVLLEDGLNFFRSTHLYDMAEPVPFCVDMINLLARDNEVVFISAVKGNHHKSKYEWLKRHFAFDGFIATQEKQYVNCDVLIEDRNKFLNKSKAPVKIKLMTPYTQCEELTCDAKVCHDWYEIYNYIKEINDEQ